MAKTLEQSTPMRVVAISVGNLFFLFLLLLAACGGGGSNPTAPLPPLVSVILSGTWQGTMTGTRQDTGEVIRCQATWDLQGTGDPDFAVGNWRVECDDGTRGGALLTVSRALFVVVVVAFPDDPFFGCAWSGNVSQGAEAFSGSWSSEGAACAVPLRGTFDLRKE